LVIGVVPPNDERTVWLVDGLTWGDLTFRVERDTGAPVRLSQWRFITGEAPLRVRRARPDDVIAMRRGSKSAVEAIRERGHSSREHPVVEDENGRIVWIPGVRHAWGVEPERAPSENGYLVIVVDQDSPWAPFEP
jgi:hypothetical protein